MSHHRAPNREAEHWTSNRAQGGFSVDICLPRVEKSDESEALARSTGSSMEDLEQLWQTRPSGFDLQVAGALNQVLAGGVG